MTTLTTNNHHSDLFQPYKLNPSLTAANWPYRVSSVFNPGATLLADGTTLLLCRVEDHSGHSHLCAARSANGVDNWEIDSKPTFTADLEHYPEELWGIEDPRITYLSELGQYAIAYTAYASGGPGVALALTKDFYAFERYGVIMQPEDKYERHGDVDKVVFLCGYTLGLDGDTLRIYYGAADTSIAMATASIDRMLQWLQERG